MYSREQKEQRLLEQNALRESIKTYKTEANITYKQISAELNINYRTFRNFMSGEPFGDSKVLILKNFLKIRDKGD